MGLNILMVWGTNEMFSVYQVFLTILDVVCNIYKHKQVVHNRFEHECK